MNIDELKVYNLAIELGESVWNIVSKWDYFAKETVGKQFVKAADSVAANISEDYGRYHYKENIQFNYYSRGSLFETKTWLTKSKNRNLISNEEYENLCERIITLTKLLNNYIKSIGSSGNELKEAEFLYITNIDEDLINLL